MNLRSKGPSNLVPRSADIRALERECARKRREEEQQSHLQRLDTDMGDIPQNDANKVPHNQ
uniref:IBB domain-containing protein n=1 Tax=Brassica oleracea var. oleracea TaxID=109376 RepID=A0A0D3CE53_BRAOL